MLSGDRLPNSKPALLFSLALLTITGCVAEPSDLDEIDGEPKELYRTGSKWPGGWVPVCWSSASTSRADFATWAPRVRADVENSWMRVARVEFAGWGSCGSNTNGVVVVNLDNSTNANAGIGYNASGPVTVNLGTARSDFDTAVLHEFGHVLGYEHEMVRPDFSDTGGGCSESDVSGGNAFGTDPDINSIMASTNYCNNNTALSPWDVAGVQRDYGRKAPGSVVGLGGRCVNIKGGTTALGAPLIAWPCYGVQNDKWKYWPGTANIRALLGTTLRCMNISGGSVSSTGSTPVISWSCSTAYANERFELTGVQLKAMGNMCVTVPSATTSAQLEIRPCATQTYERWDFMKDNRRIRLSGTNQCVNVPYASATLGNILQLYPCSATTPYENETFYTGQDSNGLIKYQNLCFNVLGGKPTSGAKIGLWDGCTAVPTLQNEQFFVSGTIQGLGQCLDLLGGNSYNGAPLGMYPCTSGAANQQWDFYW